jgi:uncharacterized protein
MLINAPKTCETFLMLHGIGPGAEAKIKASGLSNWNLALEYPDQLPLKGEKKMAFINELERFREHFLTERLRPLVAALPTKEHWRILADFREKASYFDIETDGLSIYESEPTVICCHHRGQMLTFIRGQNLDDFCNILPEIELMVSFNGASFDVPFVQNYFDMPTFPCPHVDLRWICHHKGLKGGLKQIERDIGLVREEGVEGVDGMEAVYLWQRYQRRGDVASLKRLVHYCQADVFGLVELAKEIEYR